MADFMLVYQNGDPKWMEKSPEEIQKVMAEWGAWFQQLEKSGNLRNPGAPLGPGGVALTNNGKGIQTDTAMSEVKELIGGYSVLSASSIEQATELAKGGPFLRHNPNGRVLVQPIVEHK